VQDGTFDINQQAMSLGMDNVTLLFFFWFSLSLPCRIRKDTLLQACHMSVLFLMEHISQCRQVLQEIFY